MQIQQVLYSRLGYVGNVKETYFMQVVFELCVMYALTKSMYPTVHCSMSYNVSRSNMGIHLMFDPAECGQ